MLKQLLLLIISTLCTSLILAQTTLPANMYADSVHAPFYYGVTSGDPTSHTVVLWTHITPATSNAGMQAVDWQMAYDTSFTNIINTGVITTDSTQDHTINIEVIGLNPNTTYYYRFMHGSGVYSAWGRAKTLPEGNLNASKIGVLSCSSIYSGFFNAYRRLSEREDLQLVVHLGDYIYDFVDADEQVRIPSPYPSVPQTRAEWVARHKYYLLDPDLREARRLQTWVTLWDNHDLDHNDPVPMEVFRHWLPVRVDTATMQNRLNRRFELGNLADLTIMDVTTRRNVDVFPSGAVNMLDNSQFEWLTQSLKTSTKQWHILGSQRMFGGWYTQGIPADFLALVPNDGAVFDNGSWDGYIETRNRILDTIATNQINNCMVISGDAHITLAMDLVKDPHDSIAYNKVTGEGALGTEFLPSSISRGNFDEAGVSPAYSSIIIQLSMGANPHHQHMEVNSHGYGILEINTDSIIATPYYSVILNQTNLETAGQALVMRNNENHWKRASNTALAILNQSYATISPNPANEQLNISLSQPLSTALNGALYNMAGQLVYQFKLSDTYQVNTSTLISGNYILVLRQGDTILAAQQIIVAH